MTDRHIRLAIAVIVVGIVATSFGSAAEGKRASIRPTPTTTPIVLADAEVRWCIDGEHVPQILATATEMKLIDYQDDQWLWMVRVAAAAPTTTEDVRRVGTMYTALRHRWTPWDRVCRAAYAADT